MENILLFFGGKSYEHDISIVTASQIFNKTKIDNIKLVPIYISKQNKFYAYVASNFELKHFASGFSVFKNKNFKEIVFVSGENNTLFTKTAFGLKEYLKSKVAIIACHGGDGENGKLVTFLENFNIYSQAGKSDSLAISMDKFLFKQVMKGLKVPVVRGFKLTTAEYKNRVKKIDFNLNVMGFPVVIKPNNGGSSIGLFVAKSKEEFYELAKAAFEFDDEILIEKFISNAREFNVAVVGNKDSFEISFIDEPVKVEEVLSFADKYLSSDGKGKMFGEKNSMVSQKRKSCVDLDASVQNEIKHYASLIFEKLNFSGVVRIDFLFNEKEEKLFVCEVNAIPGSLAYYFFSKNQILLNDFVLKLIDIAKSKEGENNKFNEDFMTSVLN